jgi:hypothetical protein
MSRYQNIQPIKRYDGKNMFSTRILPNVPVSDNDIYIYGQEGDTFDALAQQYYQNPSYWWIIALANKQGFGTRSVKPGVQLRIPINIQPIISQF